MKKLLLIFFLLSSFNSTGTIQQIQVWNGYYQFLPPNNITIQLGDTIQWIPLDPPTMSHTITSDNIPVGAVPFNQIWQLPADTFFQYIPQVIGLYQYVCTPHIVFGMIGEFNVVNATGVFGCTDLVACNYDSTATIDDGSCVYPIIWYQNYLICDGYSIVVGSSVYDTAGAYMDTLNASNGCDSLVHTYITVDQNTSSYDTLSVAASIVWNGMPLNVSGDYSVTLINSVGCDSIVNLNLTVTSTGISNIANNKSNLVKITDMLGQETSYKRNTPLFYIYDDGTVEKRIVIE